MEAFEKEEFLGNGVGDKNGMSWTCNYCKVVGSLKPELSAQDKQRLRTLAQEVAQIAQWSIQAEKKKLWIDQNEGRDTRPLIFADPENAWYELIPREQLACEGDLARVWEFYLRKEIFWANKIKDDRVIRPSFAVHYVFEQSDFGLEVKMEGEGKGAFRYLSPLQDYHDLEKLRKRKIVVDYEKTNRLFALAREVFDGIMEVRLEGSWWWSFGLTGDLIKLRGMENMLFDMYDHPDELHKLMEFLRDDSLEMIDFLQEQKLLSLNNNGDFIGTGAYGWCDELTSGVFDPEWIKTENMWGFAESQETVNVSPAQFEEFVFPYQLPILEKFGLNIYGCCEPLENRLEIVKRIPRLRRVTVSPWSDTQKMAQQLGRDYTFSWKQNPAYIAGSEINEEEIRREIRKTLEHAKENKCQVQILMRDILTLSKREENIIKWTQIAMEEAMSY